MAGNWLHELGDHGLFILKMEVVDESWGDALRRVACALWVSAISYKYVEV